MSIEKPSMDSVQVMHGVPIEKMREALLDAGFEAVSAQRVGRTVALVNSLKGAVFCVYLTMLEEGLDVAVSIQFRGVWTVHEPADGMLEKANAYNFRMRFGKASWDGTASEMTLEMDAITAGGVTSRYVREVIECWARVLADFMTFMGGFAEH